VTAHDVRAGGGPGAGAHVLWPLIKEIDDPEIEGHHLFEEDCRYRIF